MLVQQELLSPARSQEDEPVCWICLEGASAAAGPLVRPCKCPRDVHVRCLSRWCLHNAGKSEESTCRFCKSSLPDWKTSLAPMPEGPGAPSSTLQHTEPVMVVTLGQQIHRVRVMPGEQGRREFQAEIKRLFQIPDDVQFEVTFRCKVPTVADSVQLEGMTSYEAATHCAALMAAQRQAVEAAAMQQQQLTAQSPLHAPEELHVPQQHPLQYTHQPSSMGNLQQQLHQAHSHSQPCLSLPHASPFAPSQYLPEQCATPFPHPSSHPSSTPHLAHHQPAISTPWSQHPALPDSGYVEATATPAGTGLQCGFDAAASSTPVPFCQMGLRRSARLRAAQALLGR